MHTKACDKHRKNNPDVKDMMATLLIQHNLLGDKWEPFHKDVHKLVNKYWKTYQKGLKNWFKTGEIRNSI